MTQSATQQRLSDMLRTHVDKGDPVDVANFCAFLAARGEGIAALPTPKAEPFLQDITDALRAANLQLIRTADSYRIEPASPAYATNVRAQPAVEPVAWRLKDKERSLELGFDVYVYYGKSDFKPGIDPCELVDGLERLYTAPAPNSLDAETAIKNCFEAEETMRVLKRVVNLLLESRRNLGPEDHELRDRIDQLFRPDAAIAAQSTQEKEGHR